MPLSRSARALRAGHVVVAGAELFCVSYLWLCAWTNRRGKVLWAAIAVLVGEGVGLVVGRGDCPLGRLQERLGDPVPLVELVLPRRAAKAAVPILAFMTCVGVGVLVARSPASRRSGPLILVPTRAPSPAVLRTRAPIRGRERTRLTRVASPLATWR